MLTTPLAPPAVELAVMSLSGVQLNQQTIWSWMQSVGHQAMRQLQQEMEQLAAGLEPTAEPIEHYLAQLPLLLGADGVMVPLRPTVGKPNGKTQWREITNKTYEYQVEWSYGEKAS